MEEYVPPAGSPDTQQADGIKVTPAETKKKNRKWILWLIIIAVIILIPLIIYLVKQFEINNLKEQQQKEIADIKLKATEKVMDNNRTNLETVARVLSWAIRSELTRSNLDQANQYIIEMVKMNDYRRIILFAADGNVLLSTDKKFEGEKFPSMILSQIQGGDQISVAPQENGDLMVAAPVMGMDKKLGTIVITYKPSGLVLDTVIMKNE